MVLEQLDIHIQKRMNLDKDHVPLTKIKTPNGSYIFLEFVTYLSSDLMSILKEIHM